MTDHPLAFALRDALSAADDFGDPVQGSVIVRTVDGKTHLGQLSWVSEDGHAFSMVRIWATTKGGEHDMAETPRHFATQHVIEIFYYQAGA